METTNYSRTSGYERKLENKLKENKIEENKLENLTADYTGNASAKHAQDAEKLP
jgi:hypothetical protein